VLDLRDRPLVSAAWLADHLDYPELRIVDARWRGEGTSDQLYRVGHIPGAIHLDWHQHLSHTVNGVTDILLGPEAFAGAMSLAGIGDDARVVAYADTDHSGAARLWWALRYYGHEQVAVLDGGFTRWAAEGRPLSGLPANPPPAVFTPRPQPAWLATADEIARALADPESNVRLADTRPPEQYAGSAVWTPLGSLYLPPGRDWTHVDGRPMRGGHIPGAHHLHSVDNLDPENSYVYLSTEQLRARAEAAGLEPDQRVITYCGVGISGSLGLFALYLAGFRNLALYDASWSEWGTDPQRPVERET
jgi:thiosulfate/3-mercaptopyruvate sulfurtransferase